MNRVITYKGYQGSVEYSIEDNVYFGKILGLKRNVLSYEGETIAELEKDFKVSVDEYFDTCKQYGWNPEKPTTTSSAPKKSKGQSITPRLRS